MSTRKLLSAVLVAGVFAGFTVATGFAGSEQASAGCGNKLVFLVWPKGHAAIPRIAEFPEIRNPHVEIYRGFNSGYDVTAAGAYIIGGKPPPGIPRGDVFTACVNYGDAVAKGTIEKPRVITRETAVKCVLPGAPVVEFAARAGGVTDFYVHSGSRLLAHGHAWKTGVKLTVPSGRCTLIAPPRP